MIVFQVGRIVGAVGHGTGEIRSYRMSVRVNWLKSTPIFQILNADKMGPNFRSGLVIFQVAQLVGLSLFPFIQPVQHLRLEQPRP